MNNFREFWNTPIEEKFQYVWFLALIVASVTLILIGTPFVLSSLF